MTAFAAPIQDMRFTLYELAGFDGIAGLPGCEDATPDLVEAVLNEAGRLASEVLAPLNRVGDQEGCILENGVVRTPTGTVDAYRTFAEGGWNALPFEPDFGGQGLPWALAFAVQELWQASNLSFGLCPLLTQGAIELLQAHGSDEQKMTYLPKLISGEWTGTMNLTEPQAGSDVGALKTRAVPEGDHYRITGQKIFITYGEQDLTENIIHMVLARTPDAPEGTRGISLFLVPKFLVEADGSVGQRNDLRCASLEHKLGIHASPTAVMAYGDDGGAIGYLIGEEQRGMACMFTMMNNARIAVGIQGVGIAERAYQQAVTFARERIQGGAIVGHPDVRRMLATMKAQIAASRALCYAASAALDRSKRDPDPDKRSQAQAEVDLLTPVAKAWSSDIGCEVASSGVQVHGGMGFIEETGAAQHLRDARITPIYEGTNGIQAMDLVLRKVLRDEGAAAHRFTGELREEMDHATGTPDGLATALAPELDRLDQATEWLIEANRNDPRLAGAAATPYLRLFGTVAGGTLLARGATKAAGKLAAQEANGYAPEFLEDRIALARFYAANLLPQAAAFAAAAMEGSGPLLSLDEAAL